MATTNERGTATMMNQTDWQSTSALSRMIRNTRRAMQLASGPRLEALIREDKKLVAKLKALRARKAAAKLELELARERDPLAQLAILSRLARLGK